MKEKNFQKTQYLFEDNHKHILSLKMKDLKAIYKEMKVMTKTAKNQVLFRDL